MGAPLANPSFPVSSWLRDAAITLGAAARGSVAPERAALSLHPAWPAIAALPSFEIVDPYTAATVDPRPLLDRFIHEGEHPPREVLQRSAEALDRLAQTTRESPPTTYGNYLAVPELLALQRLLSGHPAELFFIVIHQVHELWFKVILQNFKDAKRELFQGRIWEGTQHLDQAFQIMMRLVGTIDLLGTLKPIEFLVFRRMLSPASGFQSVQFREIEFEMGLKNAAFIEHYRATGDFTATLTLERRLGQRDLRHAFYAALRKHYDIPSDAVEIEAEGRAGEGREKILSALRDIYTNPRDRGLLYSLCEALVNLDQALGLWRDHHVRAVGRVIGSKHGTGGSEGVPYLRSTTRKQAFPFLQEIRGAL